MRVVWAIGFYVGGNLVAGGKVSASGALTISSGGLVMNSVSSSRSSYITGGLTVAGSGVVNLGTITAHFTDSYYCFVSV